MRSFFDTNILVYLFDEDSPGKKARAQIFLEKETESGRALPSTQVLQEFYVAVTRELEIPFFVEKAEEVVGQFMVLPLVEISSSHILRAIRKSISLQFSFRDALIIEAAVSGGAGILYTEDLEHCQTIDHLKILNPFQSKIQAVHITPCAPRLRIAAFHLKGECLCRSGLRLRAESVRRPC